MFNITEEQRDIFNARFDTSWGTTVTLTQVFAVDQDQLGQCCRGNFKKQPKDMFPLPNLRMYRMMPRNVNPLTSDVTLWGLDRSTTTSRGRKAHTLYKDGSDTVAKKTYTDHTNPRTIQHLYEWFNEDGTVGATKTELKQYAPHEWYALLHGRRQNQIDYLIGEAAARELTSNSATLREHYATEIAEYLAEGTETLKDAIENETDQSIVAILDTQLGTPDKTIREAIIYQIT